MDWIINEKYFVATDKDGKGYNVSFSYDGTKWRFTAWPPKPPRGEIREFIEICDTLEDAQQACEKHLQTGERHETKNG